MCPATTVQRRRGSLQSITSPKMKTIPKPISSPHPEPQPRDTAPPRPGMPRALPLAIRPQVRGLHSFPGTGCEEKRKVRKQKPGKKASAWPACLGFPTEPARALALAGGSLPTRLSRARTRSEGGTRRARIFVERLDSFCSRWDSKGEDTGGWAGRKGRVRSV